MNEKKVRKRLTAGEYAVLMNVITIIGNTHSNFSVEYVYSITENTGRKNKTAYLTYSDFLKHFNKLVEKEYIRKIYNTFQLEVIEYM